MFNYDDIKGPNDQAAPAVKGPVIEGTDPVHRYRHPQGGYIEVYEDGSMQAWNAAGKKKKTSATPEKLAAGHGQWKEVSE